MVARPSVWEGAIGIRESMIVRMMRIVMRRKRLQSQSRRSQGRNHEKEVQVQREDLPRREKVSLLGEMMTVDQKDDLDHDQNERNQRDVMRVMMMRTAIDSSMRIVGFAT